MLRPPGRARSPNAPPHFPKSRLVLGRWMGYNSGVSEMCMLDEIRAKRDEIYALARRHKAEKLWVFGSCARREERPDSDVDLLVKFDDSFTNNDRISFKFAVSDMFGRHTDVVSVTQLLDCPRFARQVLRERVPV